MGATTDQLYELASEVTHDPHPREMDVLLSTGEVVSSTLLSMALHDLEQDAVSLTGGQAGIQTDGVYGRARIAGIDTKRIERELEAGRVVIVAGFQGISEEFDITTLGRGASDLTAVALAAALEADRCEIYTDVAGIYTADPLICPEARPLRDIGYEEMLELATTGARVLQSRAVEIAELYGVELLVRSSFDPDAAGTIIRQETTMEQGNKVRGITHQDHIAKVTVRGVPDRPGIAAHLFEPLAERGVSVDTNRPERERREPDGPHVYGRAGRPRWRAGGRRRHPERDWRSGRGLLARPRHGLDRWHRDGQCARLRRPHVPHAVRARDQHRHDQHQRHPHHLRRRSGPGRRRGASAPHRIRPRPRGLAAAERLWRRARTDAP